MAKPTNCIPSISRGFSSLPSSWGSYSVFPFLIGIRPDGPDVNLSLRERKGDAVLAEGALDGQVQLVGDRQAVRNLADKEVEGFSPFLECKPRPIEHFPKVII